MKTVKYLLLLIATILIAALVYFNQDYFMTTVSLTFNIQDTVYAIPGLPTIAYFGICFLLGLILAGINTLSTRFGLNKIIKKQNTTIDELSTRMAVLKTELEVFTHDPYIKKGLENKAKIATGVKPDTPVETGAVTEVKTETEAEVETVAEAATEAETETGPDMVADPDTDPEDDAQVTDNSGNEPETIIL